MVTTMTTVGYGDMPISTLQEQVFCTLLMMVGVTFFSMISGSLASILVSMDQTDADVSQKLMFLNRLQAQYRLPPGLYREVRKTIHYNYDMAVIGLNDFVEHLPPQIRIAVALFMHKRTFRNHPFFRQLGDKRLLSLIG